MIPTKLTDEQLAEFTANVIETYQRATPEQIIAGKAWYPAAHALALEIAGNASTGAGVIAALSANKGWAENQRLARLACATGEPRGHVANAIQKVRAVLDGTPAEAVLPMDKKTGHFYRCILDPRDAWAVCIDRHAHDVAVGEVYGDRERGLSTQSRYDAIANVYRAAADALDVLPQEVQAVTWVVHTNSLAGVGSRGLQHA